MVFSSITVLTAGAVLCRLPTSAAADELKSFDVPPIIGLVWLGAVERTGIIPAASACVTPWRVAARAHAAAICGKAATAGAAQAAATVRPIISSLGQLQGVHDDEGGLVPGAWARPERTPTEMVRKAMNKACRCMPRTERRPRRLPLVYS